MDLREYRDSLLAMLRRDLYKYMPAAEAAGLTPDMLQPLDPGQVFETNPSTGEPMISEGYGIRLAGQKSLLKLNVDNAYTKSGGNFSPSRMARTLQDLTAGMNGMLADGPQVWDDWERACPHLLFQVWHRMPTHDRIQVRYGDLFIAPVIDRPDSILYVVPQMMTAWARTTGEVMRRAQANMTDRFAGRTQLRRLPGHDLPVEAWLYRSQRDPHYSAAAMILPQVWADLQNRFDPADTILILPDRERAVLIPRAAEASLSPGIASTIRAWAAREFNRTGYAVHQRPLHFVDGVLLPW